jgi:hypothetical protein
MISHPVTASVIDLPTLHAWTPAAPAATDADSISPLATRVDVAPDQSLAIVTIVLDAFDDAGRLAVISPHDITPLPLDPSANATDREEVV